MRSATSCRLMVDANQQWDVGTAIARASELAPVSALVDGGATSPDDVLAIGRLPNAIVPLGIGRGDR